MTAVFVDTNVLIYRRDSSEREKQRRAEAWMTYLWGARTGRTSMQVLHEYYDVVTRKLKPGLPAADAREDVRDLMAWRPVRLDRTTAETAWRLQDRYRLGWWDALVAAAALQASCGQLLTEDLQHGLDLDGLIVTNPFTVHPPASGR
jgi:predicted nucleic acid-binding protein